MKKEMYRQDALGCILCHEANCDKACDKVDISRVLRNIYFDDEYAALNALPAINPCKSCEDKRCISACIKDIDIPAIITKLYAKEDRITLEEKDYKRLESDICSIPIENPFLLSSSVVGSSYDMCARAFEAGWAGVCYKTISMIDIHESSPRFEALRPDGSEILGFKNIEQLSQNSVEENLEIFRKLKKNYPKKFLLVSIMGRGEDEWKYLARAAQDAGADAIELNFSCPNMVEEGTGSDVGQSARAVELYTRAAKSVCTIPVIAKLTPNVEDITEFAEAAMAGGADGIAAINTIKSLIDVNPDGGNIAIGGYSGNAVKPIALRFISDIAHSQKCREAHISAMGGIETWRDAAQFITLGAMSVQVTTAVMQYGYRIIDDLKDGLAIYLKSKNTTLREFSGSGLRQVIDIEDMPRDMVILPKFDRKKCVKCLRCFISCRDGGHQAISYDSEKKPILDAKKCVGCHLCVHVCPSHCITSSGIARKN